MLAAHPTGRKEVAVGKRRTNAELLVLAGMIANRETELQRYYDLFMARRNALLAQIDAANIELVGVEAGIAQCRKRAAEQGYPNAL
jgi:hypothetical protein